MDPVRAEELIEEGRSYKDGAYIHIEQAPECPTHMIVGGNLYELIVSIGLLIKRISIDSEVSVWRIVLQAWQVARHVEKEMIITEEAK